TTRCRSSSSWRACRSTARGRWRSPASRTRTLPVPKLRLSHSLEETAELGFADSVGRDVGEQQLLEARALLGSERARAAVEQCAELLAVAVRVGVLRVAVDELRALTTGDFLPVAGAPQAVDRLLEGGADLGRMTRRVDHAGLGIAAQLRPEHPAIERD